LDTDIVVKGDLNIVFNLCTKDKLYALEEGFIDSDIDFWGKTLFENAKDLHLYTNNFTAFSSGILLFNNCDKMKQLFTIIQLDFKKRPFHFYCHDQPYIIYNAFKYGLYDNQVLKDVVVNNDHDYGSNKIIHHFPGDPGIHKDKLKFMFAFLTGLKSK
jgi:lipopolysaccharide biosynthesis glycosyltransferase